MNRDPSKSGSALIMVLAVTSVLAYLIADFGVGMRSELRAASGQYDEAMNFQLARSAVALARMELNRTNTDLYSDDRGNAFFIPKQEDFESKIEALQVYRDGFPLGRGRASYRLVYKPYSLNPNALTAAAWHRLLEVACDIEEGDTRSALVDSVLDWIDIDDLSRASGAEEDLYQTLEPPRHAKNGPMAHPEELLLVYGFTPDLLYGHANPLREDSGMLAGGGLLRYFTGDASPEGRATRRYVLDASVPTPAEHEPLEEGDFRRIDPIPQTLTLIAEGFVPLVTDESEHVNSAEFENTPPAPQRISRHIILMTLQRVGREGRFRIADMQENAPAEVLERILAYGLPEKD